MIYRNRIKSRSVPDMLQMRIELKIAFSQSLPLVVASIIHQ